VEAPQKIKRKKEVTPKFHACFACASIRDLPSTVTVNPASSAPLFHAQLLTPLLFSDLF
jgi:hypothetical protein